LGDNTYELQDTESKHIIGKRHVSELKPYFERVVKKSAKVNMKVPTPKSNETGNVVIPKKKSSANNIVPRRSNAKYIC